MIRHGFIPGAKLHELTKLALEAVGMSDDVIARLTADGAAFGRLMAMVDAAVEGYCLGKGWDHRCVNVWSFKSEQGKQWWSIWTTEADIKHVVKQENVYRDKDDQIKEVWQVTAGQIAGIEKFPRNEHGGTEHIPHAYSQMVPQIEWDPDFLENWRKENEKEGVIPNLILEDLEK